MEKENSVNSLGPHTNFTQSAFYYITFFSFTHIFADCTPIQMPLLFRSCGVVC